MRVEHKAVRAPAAPVTVLPVRSRVERHGFIAFPYALYRDSQYWTAPLRRDQVRTLDERINPFLAHSSITPFIAVDAAGSVVGRIAAIVNGMHLEKYRDGTG